jgi:hypothetical protein
MSNQQKPYWTDPKYRDGRSRHHKAELLKQIERLAKMLTKLKADLERIYAHETHEKL